jgi:Phospholipid methyltransferase
MSTTGNSTFCIFLSSSASHVEVGFVQWSATRQNVATAPNAVLHCYCFNTFGKASTGTAVVAKNQAIVQHGSCRRVRHPSCASAFLMFIGIGLAPASWISVAIPFLVHYYLHGRRVRVEGHAARNAGAALPAIHVALTMLLKNSSVIPRSMGDEESVLRDPLNCHESRFPAALEMTQVGGVSPEFQQPVEALHPLHRLAGTFR